MIKIALDPGHGNRKSETGALDCGAVGTIGGVIVRKESEHQLLFANAVKDYLLTQPGVQVVMLRTTNDDKDLGYKCNLDYRIAKASKEGCAAYVSLHENASVLKTGRGYEVYTQAKPTARDTALAQGIYDAVTSTVPVTKRGVKGSNAYRVCREPDMPSCLVETLFVDNADDRVLFDRYFDTLALATAKGILAGVGVQWQEASELNAPAEQDYKALHELAAAERDAAQKELAGLKADIRALYHKHAS